MVKQINVMTLNIRHDDDRPLLTIEDVFDNDLLKRIERTKYEKKIET